jgi:hypothetical protein
MTQVAGADVGDGAAAGGAGGDGSVVGGGRGAPPMAAAPRSGVAWRAGSDDAVPAGDAAALVLGGPEGSRRMIGVSVAGPVPTPGVAQAAAWVVVTAAAMVRPAAPWTSRRTTWGLIASTAADHRA